MEEFPEKLVPSEMENFDKMTVEQYSCYVRLELVEFLLKKSTQYYDFTQFFQKYEIKDVEIQNTIIDKMINELKDKGWALGKMFGGTSLVICSSESAMEESVWVSSLDFEKV